MFKKFIQSVEFRRFMWTLLNVLMGGIVSLLTYVAADNVQWAVAILPFATAFSQMLTKYLNRDAI